MSFLFFSQKMSPVVLQMVEKLLDSHLEYSALQKNSFFADFGKSGIAMFVIKTEK